jgi:serine/threonine protein kinase/tetratricopeptide (TPR) repeat protein
MNFGKYELLEAVGKGSIAEVFKAKSFGAEGFEKLLVIKRIQKKFSDDEIFGERFIKDTQLAIQLNHTNIVQVFDIGKADDRYYLAMEFVQGLSLASLIRQSRLRGTMPSLPLSAFIVAEVAKGLDFAHRKRGRNLKPLDIVHEDISARNILVSAEGEVKIADFGLARAKEAVSELIDRKIQPLYLSPEQLEGRPPDRRSDVFSLGVLLYELTGQSHPFERVERAKLSEFIRDRKFTPPSSFLKNDDGGDELASIIERASAFDPDKRFQDAGAVYEALIGYIYHTGTRVSAHTLFDFLQEIATEEISVSEFRTIEEDVLQEAFRFSMAPTHRPGADAAPTAVSSPSGPPSTEPPSLAPTDPARKDVAILVVDFGEACLADFNASQFTEAVENNGGSLMFADEKIAAAVFGLDLAYGRETEEALDAAFKIHRAAMVHNSAKGAEVRICVKPAKVVVAADGLVDKDPGYQAALTESMEAAKLAEEGVITTRAGRKLSSGAYHFEALDSERFGAKGLGLYHVIGRVPLIENFGRLFGRHQTLRTIGSIFSEVSAFKKGGVLAITGPAGIGKTRLVREGQWRLLSSGQDVAWFETSLDRTSKARPFSAAAAAFRAVTALETVEPEVEILEKTGRLRELGLTADEVECVAALLGAPKEEGAEYYVDAGRQLYSAMVHLTVGLSKERPTVLVFDNADDMDGDSWEVIRRVAETLHCLPVLFCLIYRGSMPDAPHIDKGLRRLELIPLSKADADQLAAASMNAERIETSFSNFMYKVTKGNPLFVEAYARSLVQAGKVIVKDKTAESIDEMDIAVAPKHPEEALSRFVDALSGEERRMLECASMIGRTFSLKLQRHLIGQDARKFRPVLSSLSQKRLIYRSSANEYTFSSALLSDVLLQCLPDPVARDMHLKMVRIIERVFPKQLDDRAAEAALHCELAGEIVSAIEYYTRAGKKATELNADRTALEFYIKSLELLQALPNADPDSILTVCLPIGRLAVRANAFELGLEKIQAAEWVAEDATDKETLVRVLLLNSELHAHCEHTVEVDWYMEWALDLASRLGDHTLSFDVLEAAGHVYFLMGNMKQAGPRFKDAIELAQKDAGVDKNQLITCMAQLAKVEAASGELEQAVKTLAEAESLLDDDSDLLARCEIEQSRGRAFFMAGNFDKSLESQLRLLDIAKEYGLKDYLADTCHLLGELYLENGEMAKAFAYLTMSKDTADEIGMKHLKSLNHLLLQYIDAVELQGANQVGDLEKLLLDALERDAVWEQLHLLYYLSKIYMEKGQHAMAKEHLQQLIKLGAKVNNRLYHNKAEELLKEIRVFEKLSL